MPTTRFAAWREMPSLGYSLVGSHERNYWPPAGLSPERRWELVGWSWLTCRLVVSELIEDTSRPRLTQLASHRFSNDLHAGLCAEKPLNKV